MIRIIVLLALLAAIAAGFAWVADRPGEIRLVWMGEIYETSLLFALAGLLVTALVLALLLLLLRVLWRMPRSFSAIATRRRIRKGGEALTRGMIAAGAGDLSTASRAAEVAAKHLQNEPLTLLLHAQTAQLAGDRSAAERAFNRMVAHPETKILGLRGLHLEARRRGDRDAAMTFAEQAHKIAPLSWAGQAVLEHHSSSANWARALGVVENNLAQRLIDRPTANRQRAVLLTALARDAAERDPAEALRLSREAADLAPDLVHAVVLAARLLMRRGDLRRAAKLIETAWKLGPHPELAGAYLDLRPGDSTSDRLQRARTLAKLVPGDLESALTVARAAIDSRDFRIARDALAPLVSGSGTQRPTVRACLLMADLEEAESGNAGLLREWLSRASRAPRDKAWVADGIVSDTWAPVSPVNGKIDAFRWQSPPESLSTTYEPPAQPPTAEVPVIEAPSAIVSEIPAEPAPAHEPVVEDSKPADTTSPEAQATTAGAPAPEAPPPEPDATSRLVAIRSAAARATPAPSARRPDVFPLVTAPDDPGPDARP